MSAHQCFALCIDCWEMHYGITDSNGVYQRARRNRKREETAA